MCWDEAIAEFSFGSKVLSWFAFRIDMAIKRSIRILQIHVIYLLTSRNGRVMISM